MKKEAKWQNSNLGRERRQFLEERIRGVQYAHHMNDEEEDGMPPKVLAAKKIVDDFVNKRRALIVKSQNERIRLCSDVRKTVLFTDDPLIANAAVDGLLATARKKGWIA